MAECQRSYDGVIFFSAPKGIFRYGRATESHSDVKVQWGFNYRTSSRTFGDAGSEIQYFSKVEEGTSRSKVDHFVEHLNVLYNRLIVVQHLEPTTAYTWLVGTFDDVLLKDERVEDSKEKPEELVDEKQELEKGDPERHWALVEAWCAKINDKILSIISALKKAIPILSRVSPQLLIVLTTSVFWILFFFVWSVAFPTRCDECYPVENQVKSCFDVAIHDDKALFNAGSDAERVALAMKRLDVVEGLLQGTRNMFDDVSD